MQKKVSLHKLENVFFLLVFLSGVAIFYGSSTVSDFLSSTTLTAKTYGMIVSGCLTVASGAKLLLNLAGAVKKEKQEMISFAEVPRMVICAVAMVVYCYGISNIGYFTCTTLFCILMLHFPVSEIQKQSHCLQSAVFCSIFCCSIFSR